MPVPNTIADLTQNPATNSPLGSETVGPNLDDYLRAISAFVRQLFDGTPHYLTSVAGTDAITANSAAPFTAYVAGQTFRLPVTGGNTTNSVTLNVNGLGAKSVTKNGTAVLSPGDIVAGSVLTLTYDGTFFQIIGVAFPSGAVGNTSFAYRNKIRNAMGKNNQRGWVSGTATTQANQYTIDDWKVIVSGQNLQFLPSGNGYTLFAPAGGIEQTIYGGEIEGGIYYLNWTGTATATINGNPIAKFGSINLPANTGAILRFFNGSVEKPQLEVGGVTPFEQVPGPLEMIRSKQFLQVKSATLASAPFGNGQCITATQALIFIPINVTLFTAPTGITFSNAGADFSLVNEVGSPIAVTGASSSGRSPDGITMLVTVAGGLVAGNSTTLIAANANAKITMSAEL